MTFRKIILTASIAALLGLSGCGENTRGENTTNAKSAKKHSHVDTQAELIAFNDEFNAIATRHDVDGFLALYTPTALWIAPGQRPVAGYDEPRKTFGFLAENKGFLSHTVDTLHISDDGSQAVMIGEAIIKVEKAGLDATGTYLFVLKHDGAAWKIVTDMFHQHDT